jgi:hypothetical protein
MKDASNQHPIQTNKEMAAAVAAYRRSGQGLKRYAREHGIPPGRLHYWAYQKDRDPQRKSIIKERRGAPRGIFQEVKIEAGSVLMESWAAEVSLDAVGNVRFSGTARPDWIRAVVQALQQPC